MLQTGFAEPCLSVSVTTFPEQGTTKTFAQRRVKGENEATTPRTVLLKNCTGRFAFLQMIMEERVLSVGIDIGTSTTQVIFSEIVIENIASVASIPRVRVIDKRLVYAGAIHLTPLCSPVEIDAFRIGELVRKEYHRAGYVPEDVQTGAVIITGETARKTNASAVLSSLAGLAGDFVVAVAGPALEGIIAGKGAGAHLKSKEKGAVVANVDIGGGTTNIAVFDNGEPVATSCLDIGGRLVTFSDHRGTVTSISRELRAFADSRGIVVREGQRLAVDQIRALADGMAEVLDQILGVAPVTVDQKLLITDHGLELGSSIDYLSFSGGVADCMAVADSVDTPFLYGDLGFFLAEAMKQSKAVATIPQLRAQETIRATVVGAGTHTTEISGSTIHFAEEVLPLQNLPVVRVTKEEEQAPFHRWPACITQKMAWLMAEDGVQVPALAFTGQSVYSFDEIQKLTTAILTGIEEKLPKEAPLVVVVEEDFGKALGQALRMRLGERRRVVCIDGIRVDNGDYIDIGKGLARGKVVPVVVKTLVFGY